MVYNLLIGGAAGQGIDTTAAILEKLLKRSGYNVFTLRDFMSRVRGGHNFSLIRFGTGEIMSHSEMLEGIVALNEETVDLHKSKLVQNGFILCDSKIASEDPRIIKIDMDAIAANIGNARVTGSVAVGSVLKLFGIAAEDTAGGLREFVDEKYVDVNIEAIKRGYTAVENRFPYIKAGVDSQNRILISGSKALALGAMAAGLKFYSAYPMSPSTPIMEYLAEHALETDVVVEQAEDEIAAINMAIGASYAGARAMTGTSGGGFSLMVEALGLSGMAEIPLVVADVQRPGPATGLPTRTEQSDLKFVISAAQGEFPRMVIALRNHTDAFYQTIRAFDLAEKYQIPVILLSDQYLGDSSSTIDAYDIDKINVAEPASDFDGDYLRYRFSDDGISPRLIPGKTENLVCIDSDEHDEHGCITESADIRTKMVNKRMKKLEKLELELQEPELIGAGTFETLLVGWGSTYGPITEAIKLLNDKQDGKYAALVFGDVYPLPKKRLEKLAGTAKQIINVEQNATGQFAGLIREQTGIVCGKSVLKYDGRQLSGEEIAERVLKAVEQ